MGHFLSVANILGKIIFVFALTMIIPYGVAVWSDDGSSTIFSDSILITLIIGIIISLVTVPYKRELQIRDGFLLVVLVWLLLPCFGMLPLLS